MSAGMLPAGPFTAAEWEDRAAERLVDQQIAAGRTEVYASTGEFLAALAARTSPTTRASKPCAG